MNTLVANLLILWFLFFGSNVSVAESWTPQPKFTIENSSYLETLTFISGVSYALTYSNVKLKTQAKPNFYCLPEGQIPDSRLLIDIVNEHLSGDHSSEEVIETIITGLADRYPCNK